MQKLIQHKMDAESATSACYVNHESAAESVSSVSKPSPREQHEERASEQFRPFENNRSSKVV
jgi:hypothetical protein